MRPARRRYDVNEAVSLKAQMQLAAEQGMSHGMLDVDFKARALRRAHAAFQGGAYMMRGRAPPCCIEVLRQRQPVQDADVAM
jgi:hypothetical protein